MTNPGIIRQNNSFDERVEIICGELELAIQWNRSAALLVIYNSEYVRADAETAIENHLIETGQTVMHLQLDETPDLNLIAFLKEFSTDTKQVFFVHGLKPESENILARLGHHKDIFINNKIRAVFWMTPKVMAELSVNAPDFWEYRQRVIEFVDMPNPDQILQTAIESAWQGTGEYTDEFEDTEEKIHLREAFLNELPENAESTSTRANLMLTLGILNWRKGDLEKANELLLEASRIAIRLEDNWFEAECYNAMALVKFSQGKHDEAIQAYKQAIAIAPEQIFVWNNLGNLCMKIQRNDEAMLAFQKALGHNAKDPIAWNGLGTVYFRIGYIDDSIAAFRKAIEFAPALANSWIGLGEAYASVGRDVDAIAAYQKAIEVNKHLASPWLKLADIYSRQGRHRDSVKTYQRALTVEPKNHVIWNELGLAHLKVNSFAEAEQAFEKASELDRSFGWAYNNLALAHASQGKFHEAIEACKKSLLVFKDDNDKAVAYDRLANFYRAVNDYENAMQAFQQADKLNGHLFTAREANASDLLEPASVEIAESTLEVATAKQTGANIPMEEAQAVDQVKPVDLITPAWVFQPEAWNQNDAVSTTFSESILWEDEKKTDNANSSEELPMITNSFANELLENVSAMQESMDPEVWNKKGNIHYQNGQYDEAIAAYNKAIELDRSFGWPYSNLAFTYLTMGKLAEAILLYQKSATVLTSKEEQAASWNSLGNIYRHLNDYENAAMAYQKADEVDPQNAGRREKSELSSGPNSQNSNVWLELGNLFFKSASYKEAVNAYAQAVNIDPTSGWAHSNLAMGLVFLGKYKQAVPIYQKSIELFTDDKDKATSWNRLGNVYRKLNDQSNAMKAYQTAMVLSNEKVSLVTRMRFTLLGNVATN